jgi:hypothetical protein
MTSKNQAIVNCFACLNKWRWSRLKNKLVFILHSFQVRFVRQRLETKWGARIKPSSSASRIWTSADGRVWRMVSGSMR